MRSKDTSDKGVEARLLAGAQEHIARYGLEKFQVNSIAKSAGTSASQVYRYYRDKDALVVEVFGRGLLLLEGKIHDELRTDKSRNPKETVKKIIACVFDAFEQDTNAISAAVVLGQTVGSPLRDKMRGAQGYLRQKQLVEQFAKSCKTELPSEIIAVVTEVIFGTLHRLLFCLTPYKNHGRLTTRELAEKRKTMELVLADVVEGSILSERVRKARKVAMG